MPEAGCVNAMVPGRIKFDPDFYPDAPWVDSDLGGDYLAKVQARCPSRTGALLASLRVEERAGRAWVSSDLDYSGIILEWGSCMLPPSWILSAAANETMGPRSRRRGAQGKRARAGEPSEADILAGLREDLGGIVEEESRAFVKGLRGTQRKIAQNVFEQSVRSTVREVFRQSAGDPALAELLKAPFRSTPTTFGARPPAKLLRQIRRMEPLRITDGVTRAFRRAGLL